LPPFKVLYLVPWFFVLRTVIYFVVFWLLAFWQRASWGTDRMIRSASAALAGNSSWLSSHWDSLYFLFLRCSALG